MSRQGRDTGEGTQNDPLRTIHEARDLIRQMRASESLDNTSVNVFLHSGRYEQVATLEFTKEDSGSSERHIVYQSVDGEVIVTGGIELTG